MTKEEFYLKTIIAMCSNPNYVEVKECDDEEGKEPCICHTLLVDEIVMDASRLLRETTNEWEQAFSDSADAEYVADKLDDISANLADIKLEIVNK